MARQAAGRKGPGHPAREGELQQPWREGEERVSRAVFIGRHLDQAMLKAGFEATIAAQ
jgi:G3E family GTPase